MRHSFLSLDSKQALRTCLKSKGSSIFGIILADFRLKFHGLYTSVDITPEILIENRPKRTRKSTELQQFPLKF